MILRLLGRGKLLLLHRPGLYAAARRLHALGRYILRRPHEPDFAAFRKFAGRTGLFLDVGANVGTSALSFRLYNRESPILSVEPNPRHARDLRLVGRLVGNHTYLIAAAGERNGWAQLHVPMFCRTPLTGLASMKPPQEMNLAWWVDRNVATAADPGPIEMGSQLIRVRLLRLDDLALQPSFIKIDVEGLETEVVRGLLATIEQHRPVLLVELTSAFESLRALLSAASYSTYVYERDANRFRSYDGRRSVNVFFLPDEAPIP